MAVLRAMGGVFQVCGKPMMCEGTEDGGAILGEHIGGIGRSSRTPSHERRRPLGKNAISRRHIAAIGWGRSSRTPTPSWKNCHSGTSYCRNRPETEFADVDDDDVQPVLATSCWIRSSMKKLLTGLLKHEFRGLLHPRSASRHENCCIYSELRI